MPGARRTIQLGLAGAAIALVVLAVPPRSADRAPTDCSTAKLAAQESAARAVAQAMEPHSPATRAPAPARSDGQAAVALY